VRFAIAWRSSIEAVWSPNGIADSVAHSAAYGVK
jgi:hypothetical protein